MPQELAGRPGEKGLQSYQFDCLKCLVRTVAHRLFDEPRDVVIVDILVVHGGCTSSVLSYISDLDERSVQQVCQKLQDINFIRKALLPKQRVNRDGHLENIRGNIELYFIDYPRALDAIRFVLHQMDRYVQRQYHRHDEDVLYYCPPRTVTVKMQVEQKSSKAKGRRKTERVWVDKQEHIGCANSGKPERQEKRYTYLEYMSARVRVHNTEAGADEWRHYCPWCFRHRQTLHAAGQSVLPELQEYKAAATGFEDIDVVLLPIRELLAELDREPIEIPVLDSGMLYEEAMDKFVTEQRKREKLRKRGPGSVAEEVRPAVHVDLSDRTRLVDVTEEAVTLEDKRKNFVVQPRRLGSIAQLKEGLTPVNNHKKHHSCDCCYPKQRFSSATALVQHIEQVKADCAVQNATKRARLHGEFTVGGVAEAKQLHQQCSSMCAESSTFLRSDGTPVHCRQLTRADIAAMPPVDYQRYSRIAPLLTGGDATVFLPKPGQVMFGCNAAGQFLSGSYADATTPHD